MQHIIYPCDLTLTGECPKDKWGCNHECADCKPYIIDDEEVGDNDDELS